MPGPTPPTGPDDGAGLTPDREAAVRRLLAESAGPEPVPPAVAERLDETLAGLVAERSATGSSDALVSTGVAEEHGVVLPRDDLAARRRRKTRVLLAAAAAVVVGAVAAGQLVDDPAEDLAAAERSAEEDPARTADAAAEDDGGATMDGLTSAPGSISSLEPGEDSAGEPEGEVVLEPLERVATDQPLRTVRADRLREDLVALQHVSLPDPSAVDYSGAVFAAPEDFMCEPADFGAGYLVAVEYAGRPAVVVFRAPAGTTQAADVLACGTGDTLHSVTLATSG